MSTASHASTKLRISFASARSSAGRCIRASMPSRRSMLTAAGLAGDDAPSTLASFAVLALWAGALIIAAQQYFIRRDVT